MLMSLPYLRAGLCHYTFSISFRISSPFIISILSNIMILSIVLFLRALLVVALAASLSAGNQIPPTEENLNLLELAAEQKKFLTRGKGNWLRTGAPPDLQNEESKRYKPYFMQVHFEVDRSDNLHVGFFWRADKKSLGGTELYVVSSTLKSKGPEGPKNPYNLIRGSWRRNEDGTNDNIEISGTPESTTGELHLRHLSPMKSEANWGNTVSRMINKAWSWSWNTQGPAKSKEE